MNDNVEKQMIDKEIEQSLLATLHEEYIELQPEAELLPESIPSIDIMNPIIHDIVETKHGLYQMNCRRSIKLLHL